MGKWLIMLFLLSVNIYSRDATFRFEGNSKRVEIREMNSRGHGLFENGRFIKYYPTQSRGDLNHLISDIEKYRANTKKLSKITRALNDNFEKKLKVATDKELIETSFALAKIASESLKAKEIECNEENGLKTKTSEEVKKEETVYCECELPKESSLALEPQLGVPSFDGEFWDDYSLLGKLEAPSLTITTSNDNHLHGLFRKFAGDEYDGNDRGRTFGLNMDYSLKGTDGEFRVNFESVIFTQMYEAGSEDMFYINDKGEFLQDVLERNRLDVSLRKKTDKGKYVIFGTELEQLSDNGGVSTPIQKAWHSLSKKNNIQYDNQSHMKDQLNLTLYGGIGREWIKDVGNWKCTTKLEGTIGQNVLNFNDTYIKGRGEIEFNSNNALGGSKDNPFVLVTMWAEGSLENQDGNQTGAGINMSFPTRIGKWEIKPQVGFSIKNEKEDRYFTQAQSRKLEPESHLGITFSRKF